jgi:hypothetical protein
MAIGSSFSVGVHVSLGFLLLFLLSKDLWPYISWPSVRKDGKPLILNSKKEVAQEVRRLILKGEQPYLPPEVFNSTNPAIKAMLQARMLATTHDADKRPRARDTANFLVETANDSPNKKEKTGRIADQEDVPTGTSSQNEHGLQS